ncbi:hypothetical protein BDF14DRAFT_1909236, partial [Spinellus fusiger]
PIEFNNYQKPHKTILLFLHKTLSFQIVLNQHNMSYKLSETHTRGEYDKVEDKKLWSIYYLLKTGLKLTVIASVVEMKKPTVQNIVRNINKYISLLHLVSHGIPKKSMRGTLDTWKKSLEKVHLPHIINWNWIC